MFHLTWFVLALLFWPTTPTVPQDRPVCGGVFDFTGRIEKSEPGVVVIKSRQQGSTARLLVHTPPQKDVYQSRAAARWFGWLESHVGQVVTISLACGVWNTDRDTVPPLTINAALSETTAHKSGYAYITFIDPPDFYLEIRDDTEIAKRVFALGEIQAAQSIVTVDLVIQPVAPAASPQDSSP